jgi:hypothetical protein
MIPRLSVRALLIAAFIGSFALPAGHAGAAPTDPSGARVAFSLRTPLTIEPRTVDLRDALRWLETASAARIRACWRDNAHADGLAPEASVELRADRTPMLQVLESLLRQADQLEGGGATWQVNESGEIEVGPRTRLNEHRVLRVYDVRDLLNETPDYDHGATLDLAAALDARSGGSIIRDGEHWTTLDADRRQRLAEELIEQSVTTEASSSSSRRATSTGRSTRRPARDTGPSTTRFRIGTGRTKKSD